MRSLYNEYRGYMYYLIINGEKVDANQDFDKLQEKVDSEMEGFVVDAKDWEARKN